MTNEDPAAADLERSRAAAQAWRSEYAQSRLDLVRQEGRIPFSRDELDQGRQRFDVVRQTADDLLGTILTERDAAAAELRRATRLLVIVVSWAVSWIWAFFGSTIPMVRATGDRRSTMVA